MSSKQQQQARLTFKFLLVGNGNVGKTSIVRRLCRGDFISNPETTIGVEFMTKLFDIDGNQVKLQIWDTAGQEKYRSVGKAYYRNAIGVLLVFSLTDHVSFEKLEEWISDVSQYCHPKAHMILVGNKSDLTDARTITQDEIRKFAEGRSLQYIESSAKTGSNINECFYQVAKAIYDGIKTGDISISNAPATIGELDNKPSETTSKQGCSC